MTVELTAALVVVAMAVVAVAYIARPLFDAGAREPGPAERRLSALYAERDQTLSLLHELDMDYAMGKITAEDYQAQRAAHVQRGADVLREIDELGGSLPTPSESGGAERADLEARIARLRDRAAGFCRNCGSPVAIGDRFCASCGHPVGEAAS